MTCKMVQTTTRQRMLPSRRCNDFPRNPETLMAVGGRRYFRGSGCTTTMLSTTRTTLPCAYSRHVPTLKRLSVVEGGIRAS